VAILDEIIDVVVKGDKDTVLAAVDKALKANTDPTKIIKDGLTQGLNIVGDKFEKLEVYLPEMLLSAEAVKAGVEKVKPHIQGEGFKEQGVIVIGTIQGDVHDIGKNIVGFYLDACGFKINDLGCDVPISTFVDRAEETNADIICISALLTTTMTYIPDVIEELKRRDLRKKYKIMVGGGAVTPDWAKKIDADGSGDDFAGAARVAKELMKGKAK